MCVEAIKQPRAELICDDTYPELITNDEITRCTFGDIIFSHLMDSAFDLAKDKPFQPLKRQVVMGDNCYNRESLYF